MRTLLVAERFNLGDGRRWVAADRHMEAGSYLTWLHSSLTVGAYGAGMTSRTQMNSVGRRKLLSLGIPSDFKALNLLPPADCGAWEADVAARVADVLRWNIVLAHEEVIAYEEQDRELSRWCFDRIVLIGKRVAVAMGQDARSFFIPMGGTIVVPHPSGRNLWWNDRDALLSAQQTMKEFFSA